MVADTRPNSIWPSTQDVLDSAESAHFIEESVSPAVGGKKAFPRRSKGMLSGSLFQGHKDRRMTLSAMVARPTGRNWVRADRFGGRCKAFLCRGEPANGTS